MASYDSDDSLDVASNRSVHHVSDNSASKQLKSDAMNPYFIHSNENPSLVLVKPPLEGPNYHGWLQAMTMALEMKNKFIFVDGSIVKPSTSDPIFPVWKHCNMLVLSWINHSVSSEISSSILWITEAYNVWQELKNRFSQGDNIRISQLQHDIFSLKQSDLSITAYFTKMRILWDELCNYRPIPVCGLNAGCCETFKVMDSYRENDAVMSFLQGLNENYASVKSQILLMEPLPSLAKVYFMVIQQERQLSVPILSDPAVLVVQTGSHEPYQSQGRGKGRGRGLGVNRVC